MDGKEGPDRYPVRILSVGGGSMSERDVPQPPQRRDRLIHERVHDPYKTRLKLVDPSVCPQCGAERERSLAMGGAAGRCRRATLPSLPPDKRSVSSGRGP